MLLMAFVRPINKCLLAVRARTSEQAKDGMLRMLIECKNAGPLGSEVEARAELISLRMEEIDALALGTELEESTLRISYTLHLNLDLTAQQIVGYHHEAT